MVIKMTNRLLGIVIALALSSGIVAHAATAPQRPLAPISLASANVALHTAASHVAETATGTIDPAGAVRDAYQRDLVALEHLRQQAMQRKGSAHLAFNQHISDRETALIELKRSALATSRPAVASTIAAMDKLVAEAQAELDVELSQTGSANSTGSQQTKASGSKSQSSQSDQSGQSGQSGQSNGNGH
jgi:hypothetical protein